jgi:hypothetical protein
MNSFQISPQFSIIGMCPLTLIKLGQFDEGSQLFKKWHSKIIIMVHTSNRLSLPPFIPITINR